MEVLSHKIYKSICNKQAAKKKRIATGRVLTILSIFGARFWPSSISFLINPSISFALWLAIDLVVSARFWPAMMQIDFLVIFGRADMPKLHIQFGQSFV